MWLVEVRGVKQNRIAGRNASYRGKWGVAEHISRKQTAFVDPYLICLMSSLGIMSFYADDNVIVFGKRRDVCVNIFILLVRWLTLSSVYGYGNPVSFEFDCKYIHQLPSNRHS